MSPTPRKYYCLLLILALFALNVQSRDLDGNVARRQRSVLTFTLPATKAKAPLVAAGLSPLSSAKPAASAAAVVQPADTKPAAAKPNPGVPIIPKFQPQGSKETTTTTTTTTTTPPTTSLSGNKKRDTTPFDFDKFMAKEEAEISNGKGGAAYDLMSGMQNIVSSDGMTKMSEVASSAFNKAGNLVSKVANLAKGGSLTDLVSSAGELFSDFVPGFKTTDLKTDKKKNDTTEPDPEEAPKPEGEAVVAAEEEEDQEDDAGKAQLDATEDEVLKAATIPYKVNLGSFMNNAGDLLAPHLKALGVGAGGASPFASLLSNLGGLFGGGAKPANPPSQLPATDAPLD